MQRVWGISRIWFSILLKLRFTTTLLIYWKVLSLTTGFKIYNFLLIKCCSIWASWNNRQISNIRIINCNLCLESSLTTSTAFFVFGLSCRSSSYEFQMSCEKSSGCWVFLLPEIVFLVDYIFGEIIIQNLQTNSFREILIVHKLWEMSCRQIHRAS